MSNEPLLSDKGGYNPNRYKDQRKQHVWFYDMRHSLRMRTNEVKRSLKICQQQSLNRVLDVGSADNLMLDSLSSIYNDTLFIGTDLSYLILRISQCNIGRNIQSDANKLPFANETFDAVIAAAIIEHLSDVHCFFQESYRVLSPNGILILTTPDPFWDELADQLGIYKGADSGHQMHFDLSMLYKLCADNGFEVVITRKFMLTPISIPGIETIENILRTLKLDFLFANQVVAARRL